MWTSMSSVEEEEEECRHFINVCRAFCSYEKEGLREVQRIEKHLAINQSFIGVLLGEQELDSLYHGDKKWTKGAVAHALEQEEYDETMDEELCVCDGADNKGYICGTCDSIKGTYHKGVEMSGENTIKHEVDSSVQGCSPIAPTVAIPASGCPVMTANSNGRVTDNKAEGSRKSHIQNCEAVGIESVHIPDGPSSLDELQDRKKSPQPCEDEHDSSHYHHHVHADPVPLGKDMSKVRSTLRQFVRDWSDEGAAERNSAYGPLLEAMEQYLPIADPSKVPRVLCPGSGLGRLPFEVAKRGYASQGNEFSYYMLLGSNFALNYSIKPYSFPLQPYCLSTSNRRGYKDNLRTIWIPDTCPGDFVSTDKEFSMCAGEFIEVYGDQKGMWDGVLTCFFIDTAKNVLAYIETIASIIRPGGLWSNFGPLLYHYSEMPNEMSIELSWEEIKTVVERYFTLKTVDWRESYYTSNDLSMMQVLYHCIFFVGIRNDKDVEVDK